LINTAGAKTFWKSCGPHTHLTVRCVAFDVWLLRFHILRYCDDWFELWCACQWIVVFWFDM